MVKRIYFSTKLDKNGYQHSSEMYSERYKCYYIVMFNKKELNFKIKNMKRQEIVKEYRCKNRNWICQVMRRELMKLGVKFAYNKRKGK